MNGRFVSRDASEISRKLREMMQDAPDGGTRHEIQRLADKKAKRRWVAASSLMDRCV